MTSVSQTLLPLSYILVVWFKKLLHIFDPFIGKTHVYKYYYRLLWHFLYLSARTCYVKILLFSLTGLFLASVLYVSQNVLLYISSKGEVTWVLHHDHRIYIKLVFIIILSYLAYTIAVGTNMILCLIVPLLVLQIVLSNITVFHFLRFVSEKCSSRPCEHESLVQWNIILSNRCHGTWFRILAFNGFCHSHRAQTFHFPFVLSPWLVVLLPGLVDILKSVIINVLFLF